MPPVTNSYLNTLSFPGYSDNINKTYLDFLKIYEPKARIMFIQREMGESGETTVRIDEQDMQQYAHDKPQGVDAQRLQFGQGYFKNIYANRIGAQLNISYEMRVAKNFEIGMAMRRFNASVPNRVELDRQHFAVTFVNVTSYVNMDGRTVDMTAGDGQAPASATHPLAFSPLVWSNIVPGNPQLSVTALESAQQLAVTDILDNYGYPVEMTFTHLVVNKQSPQTCRVAREILRSTTLITQANPGVINTFSQMYELIELPLASTDAQGRQNSAKYRWWSLHALTGENRAQMYEMTWENPHMTPGFQDPYNDDYVWGSRGRYGFGRVSARGQIYSLPA
jgi:hypothetical protein